MLVDKTKENIEKCRCMKCPSYSERCKLKNAPENFLKMMENFQNDRHFEKMFCAYEKSNCIYQNHGCICSTCDVYKKYNLHKMDYCTHTGGI
jgi:hypothetical protein